MYIIWYCSSFRMPALWWHSLIVLMLRWKAVMGIAAAFKPLSCLLIRLSSSQTLPLFLARGELTILHDGKWQQLIYTISFSSYLFHVSTHDLLQSNNNIIRRKSSIIIGQFYSLNFFLFKWHLPNGYVLCGPNHT